MEELFGQIFPRFQETADATLQIFEILEIVGYFLIVVFIAGIIYCSIMLLDVQKKADEELEDHFVKRTASPQQNPQMNRWQKVVSAISSDDEQLWRVAILEADTILEEVVSHMQVPGETLGEQLKNLGNREPWIDAAWEVHKLRNILAHEGGRYALNHREAYRAYKIYEGIFLETGYIS